MGYDKNGNYITPDGRVIPAFGSPSQIAAAMRPMPVIPGEKNRQGPQVRGKSLKPVKPPVKDNKKDVVVKQSILRKNGYDIKVDGDNGPVTKAATKAMANGVDPEYFNKKIDPEALAKAATDAEYGPQINDAKYNRDYAVKALPETLKDLAGWNKQVTDTFNTYDATKGFDTAIKGAETSADNVANLFGESTAAEAQAQNAPGVDMLRGLQASQGGFQDIMQSVLAAQGRDYARRATREGNNDIVKAKSDLTSLRAAKGAAQSKALFDAQNIAINQDTARQALEQAKLLQDPTIRAAEANATAAEASAANAPALAKIQLAEAKANLKKLQNTATGVINMKDPATVRNVGSGALAGAIGPNGGLTISPNIAWENAMLSLVPYGLQGNPKALAAVQSAFIRALNVSHSKGQNTAWSFKNGRVVFDSARAKANTAARKKKNK